MGSYDVAQICLNGHVIDSSVNRSPQSNEKHCPKCGALTICACQHCKSNIQGAYDFDGVVLGVEYVPPSFCLHCGKPHPWTASKVEAAEDLCDLSSLSSKEKAELKVHIYDIIRDTPRTVVAAVGFQRLIAKVEADMRDALLRVVEDVAVDKAKGIITQRK